MRLTILTNLIIQINKLIDTGKYTWISPRDVQQQIETGEIFRYIADRGRADVDLSFLDGNVGAEVAAELKNLLGDSGVGRGKWGVANTGLSFLLTCVAELIQSGPWML